MVNDKLYSNFFEKWKEVTELPPQTVGPLTPFYKKAVPFLKNAPWKVLVPLAFLLVAAVALFHEITAAQITSILQRAF